jgi:uncharacterized damage-inducible protein DinB
MKRHREVQRLLDMLEEAYRGPAWHGPALRQSLGGVTARDAARRPAGARNSIREIALHAAYWKYAVRRRLTGEKRGSFALKGSNWFRRRGADARAWREELEVLDAEHRALCRAVAALRPASLARRLPGSRYTAERLVLGIAFHDVYHAGQVRLLKRLLK